jgi:cytochrome c-type biogenesis protein CcmH/NrfG
MLARFFYFCAWKLVLASLCMVALLGAEPISAQTHAVAGDFATLSAQADAARDAEQLDQAVTLYRKALALRPAWKEGWWSVGTILYDQNSYSSAAHAFRRP